MSYNVFGGTLSINQSIKHVTRPLLLHIRPFTTIMYHMGPFHPVRPLTVGEFEGSLCLLCQEKCRGHSPEIPEISKLS